MSALPKIVFGTSGLGNLYFEPTNEVKSAIVGKILQNAGPITVFDSAGKYGAGLALECLGKALRDSKVEPGRVMISNKLGWFRTELTTQEPTFEPGIWKNLKFDAVQRINYQGIIECFEQGNELLNGYVPQMVSVHDPDEYLNSPGSSYQKKIDDILDAYQALFDLKSAGKVSYIGIGAKDWKVIKMLSKYVKLDWAMFANSLTIFSHPHALRDFVQTLQDDHVSVINAAVFHSGFLVGSDFYDYKKVERGFPANERLFEWRERFFQVCRRNNIKPAHACVQFALQIPGINAVALNPTEPSQVDENVKMCEDELSRSFWEELQSIGLINFDFAPSTK